MNRLEIKIWVYKLGNNSYLHQFILCQLKKISMKIFVLLLETFLVVQCNAISMENAIKSLKSEIWDFSTIRQELDDFYQFECNAGTKIIASI